MEVNHAQTPLCFEGCFGVEVDLLSITNLETAHCIHTRFTWDHILPSILKGLRESINHPMHCSCYSCFLMCGLRAANAALLYVPNRTIVFMHVRLTQHSQARGCCCTTHFVALPQQCLQVLTRCGATAAGLAVRMPCSFFVVYGGGFTWKERLFFAFAWTPKVSTCLCCMCYAHLMLSCRHISLPKMLCSVFFKSQCKPVLLCGYQPVNSKKLSPHFQVIVTV